MNFNLDKRQQIFSLQLARHVIQHGCKYHQQPDMEEIFDQLSMGDKLIFRQNEMQQLSSSFVTLKTQNDQEHLQLRGCMGSLLANMQLVRDIAEHAYAAAFNDPRFPAVKEAEVKHLHISISILSPQEKMNFHDEQELLTQLRPGVDGLTIESKGQSSTFLPSVWQQIPDRKEFLQHLKMKAGFTPDYWASDFCAKRYEAACFQEQ